MSLLSRLAVQAARAYGILSSSDKTKVSASYLVVAGGGGSTANGAGNNGGGGAGGFRSGTSTLSTLNTYTVAVGAGGSSTANGVDSSLSGTGLTTITSTGGGYGALFGVNGASGGSGGGAGQTQGLTLTGGAGNTPSTSPSQGNNGGSPTSLSLSIGACGGGGASAVGANCSSAVGGAGGAGSANPITGSTSGQLSGGIYYFSGGGGGASHSASAVVPAGGLGGGGNGKGNSNGTAATSGTANTGGGAGGVGENIGSNTSGGSGIVIISYTSATPKFVGGTLTTSGGNQIHTFTSSGTLSPITPVTASYLVVAGGGAGGGVASTNYYGGGGGGAGGLLTSSTTLYSGATYVVTVGAGAAGSATNTRASNGSDSSLSGTGLTTLTSTGGGSGGTQSTNTGASGGSGGGGQNSSAGGSGTSGQGYAGGTAVSGGAGGGGGSSAVGSNGTSSNSGAGGNGTASSITGSSVTYAGGGGGGGYKGNPAINGAAGGSGGGGTGAPSTGGAGGSGTPNSGSGGGGACWFSADVAGGNGGSGTVIISYAGSQVFNGGLVTSSGGNTIHTFNATGALTPLTNNLNNSLRFRGSASGYLSRTPTIAGNQKTWTWSAWIKRGTLGSLQVLTGVGNVATGTTFGGIYIDASDYLYYYDPIGGGYKVTTQVFRDPSAWYHIVVALDAASTSVKLYVNGNQITSFSTSTNPSNTNGNFNAASATAIGRNSATSAYYFDGYMTDINFIDGQALEPYYFGNNDAYGNWKPIKYVGTYGTNGYYLTFGNTTSTTTLGYDSSPNGNNWTTSGISITAGTTYDAMLDVPTNTSATVANYAVMNPVALGIDATLTNGNLNIAYGSAATRTGTAASIGMTSGKYYWEVTITASSANPCTSIIGISNTTENATVSTGIGYYPGATSQGWGYFGTTGNKYNNTDSAYGATYTTNDVIGIAFDADAGTLTFYKNNTSQGTAYSGLAAGTYYPAVGDGGGAGTVTMVTNFGQQPFIYTPPTGYVRLNTYNIPTPTILQGNLYMDATLYTGTGVSQVVVNQGQFQPDFVWIKGRSGATDNKLTDSVRGVTKALISNTTATQTTDTNGLTTFNFNGWNIGSDTNYNTSAATYVGWQWKASNTTAVSGTGTGGVTSVTYSANTTAGFSIVQYTETSSSGTATHGLGIAPSFIITKDLAGANNWNCYHVSLGATKRIQLNSTVAADVQAGVWNNTAPTSTVFTLGSSLATAGAQIAYCFAEIAGFSKFGSYTGNGSTDGPFVYLGFRPKFLLIKMSSATGDWYLFDSSRDTYNITTLAVSPNSAATETSYTGWGDLLSNGFKIRRIDAAWNTSGGTYIFVAWAENPFKNSNAR